METDTYNGSCVGSVVTGGAASIAGMLGQQALLGTLGPNGGLARDSACGTTRLDQNLYVKF